MLESCEHGNEPSVSLTFWEVLGFARRAQQTSSGFEIRFNLNDSNIFKYFK
jgi:hypothetical protein